MTYKSVASLTNIISSFLIGSSATPSASYRGLHMATNRDTTEDLKLCDPQPIGSCHLSITLWLNLKSDPPSAVSSNGTVVLSDRLLLVLWEILRLRTQLTHICLSNPWKHWSSNCCYRTTANLHVVSWWYCAFLLMLMLDSTLLVSTGHTHSTVGQSKDHWLSNLNDHCNNLKN